MFLNVLLCSFLIINKLNEFIAHAPALKCCIILFFNNQWTYTLRKLYFHFFLSHWMGYDRGDSCLFDFEPNGFLLGSESKGKMSPRSYPIQCERNWKYSILSVARVPALKCWIILILNNHWIQWVYSSYACSEILHDISKK